MGQAVQSLAPKTVDAIYRGIGREIWAILYARCCDRELALEATQEAFLRLQQQELSQLDDPRRWLIRVGENWLRDSHRKRRRTEPLVDGFELVDPYGRNNPANAAIAGELHQQVRDALGELGPEDREAIVLRYALQWPSDRIADALETTPAAVDARLSRARRRLAELFEQRGVSHEAV